jgi:hypothetical protein
VEVNGRWILAPKAVDGTPVRFYLDTGGGANMLFQGAVDRFRLPVERRSSGGDTISFVAPPPLAPGEFMPPIPASELLVPPPAMAHGIDVGSPLDGFLGRLWFADRVWTFDYPAGRLSLHESAPPAGDTGCWVPLGFQTDSTGHRTTNFPRIPVVIDEDSLELLFDTGATTTLTDAALGAVEEGGRPGPSSRATSFIAKVHVDRWHGRHPDWPVVDSAEQGTGARMIRVPEVRVGGIAVGPVWFTERPDRNFHQYMSQWMDRRIEGALGGSALRYLRVTVDYPGARARFERPAPN